MSVSTSPAPTVSAPQSVAPSKKKLKGGVLNYWEVLAQSIALISPTMTAALIVPLMFGTAGNGGWLAFAFAAVMLLFVALCLNEFAKRSTTAGAMYAYVTRGMGSTFGGIAGWSLIWAYLFISMAGLTGFTNFAQVLLSIMGVSSGIVNSLGVTLLLCAVCLAASFYCAWKDVKLSAILMLILEVVSVAMIVVLAFIVLFHKGFPVDPPQLTLQGTTFSMIAFGVVVAVFSQVGFEAATAFGSEAKNPLVNIPKAVIWSLVTTGLFFVFITYTEVYGTRGDKTTLDQLTAPLNTLAQEMKVGWMAVPLTIGAMVSFFALNLSTMNSGARVLYKMGSHKMFHESVSGTHATNSTPHVAIGIVTTLMALVVTGLMIWHNVDSDIFGYVGTFGAFGFLGAYFLVSIAAPMYLKKIGELKPQHIIVSAIAVILLMVPAIGSVYTNPPLTPPVKYFVYIYAAYIVIGFISCIGHRKRESELMDGVTADLESPGHVVEFAPSPGGGT
jgi:amino acid transporter